MSSLHSDNPRFRHLSEGEIKAIAEDDKAGMSKAAIARKYGISRPSVYRAIERGRGLTKRPPSASRVVYTRLSPSELADLDRIARNLDISRAALMSLALRQVAGFVAAEPDLVDALNDLSVQIRAVGGNINQIARQVNRAAKIHGSSSLDADQWRQLDSLDTELRRAIAKLDRHFVHFATSRQAKVKRLLAEVQQ